MNAVSKWLMALGLLVGPIAANAQLSSVDGGLGVYDATLNVTWISNGNLFSTLSQASGNPAAFVQTIINDSGGVINIPGGTYTLSASDFYSSGQMTIYGGVAWVNYLNAISYGGSTQWALPIVFPGAGIAPGQSGPSTGQLPELFYTLQQSPSSLALFTNLTGAPFWQGPLFGVGSQGAWQWVGGIGGFNDINSAIENPALTIAVAPGLVNTPVALLVALQAQVTGVAPDNLETKATQALKRVGAACTALADFVSVVQSQDGKKISPTLDAQLTTSADAILGALGCN